MDIIFGVLVIPTMIFLFPVSRWIQWHPDYVLYYVIWLYGVWFLCRKAIGPLFTRGWPEMALAAGSLFLVGVVTFLMTLTPVSFTSPEDQFAALKMHQRAMWILLLAVVSAGIPVGALSSRNRELKSRKDEEEELRNTADAISSRREEALSGQDRGDIQLKTGYSTVHVPVTAIRYIEGRNNYACFHLDHRNDVVSQITLKSVMEMLPEGKFARIHRSYIVPLWRIEKRSATSVKLMGVEETLPVGRAYKETLNNG